MNLQITQLLALHSFYAIKKAEHWRIDALELWCWRRPLRVPWTARRSNQSILKEVNTEYSLEGLILMLKLKLLWPPDVKNWLTGKDPDAGKDWRQEEKGATEDEMVGWHHRLIGLEFEQTGGDSEGQGSLVCCSPWSWKELDKIERLNNISNNNFFHSFSKQPLSIHHVPGIRGGCEALGVKRWVPVAWSWESIKQDRLTFRLFLLGAWWVPDLGWSGYFGCIREKNIRRPFLPPQVDNLVPWLDFVQKPMCAW